MLLLRGEFPQGFIHPVCVRITDRIGSVAEFLNIFFAPDGVFPFIVKRGVFHPGILLGVDEIGHNGQELQGVVPVVCKLGFRDISAFGLDQNDTVAGPCAIYGCRRGVFEDTETLNIVGIKLLEIGLRNRHAVDNEKRVPETADVDIYARVVARLSVHVFDKNPGGFSHCSLGEGRHRDFG